MKKLIATVILMLTVGYAVASCPTYAPYRCYQSGSKMVCGCGV
jgi:hypothetical protein